VDVEVLSGDDRDTFVQEPEVATVLAFRTTAERRSDLVVVGPLPLPFDTLVAQGVRR